MKNEFMKMNRPVPVAVATAEKEEAKVLTPVEKLEQKVPEFYASKTQMEKFKKTSDTLNAEIKEIMIAEKLVELNIAGFSVSCTKTVKTDFIEDMLIAKLKELKADYLIKTREYVDMNLLETALYNEKVSAADILDCQTEKPIITLRVKETNGK